MPAKAQRKTGGACPIGTSGRGGRDGTVSGSSALTLRPPHSGSRRQPIKKAISRRPESGRAARATIPPMSHTTPARAAAVASLAMSPSCWSPHVARRPRRRARRRRQRPLDRADPAPSAPQPSARERRPGRDAIYDAVEKQVIAIRGLKPSSGRPPVHRRDRAAHDVHQAVRRGNPARLPRRQRAPVQGARADPGATTCAT